MRTAVVVPVAALLCASFVHRASADGGAFLGYGVLQPPKCSGGNYCEDEYAPTVQAHQEWRVARRITVGGAGFLHYENRVNKFLMLGPSAAVRVEWFAARVSLGYAWSNHEDHDGGFGNRDGVAAGLQLTAALPLGHRVAPAVVVDIRAMHHDTGTPTTIGAGIGAVW